MSKSLLFLFLLSFCFFSKAQNLVPNNGFDTYTNCVTGSSQTTLTPPWSNVAGVVGTPDYMNACFINGQQGVPNNFYGYQQPITTGGYYGLITHYSGQEVREYLTVPLSSTLVAGTVYSVGFHVSLSDNFKFATDHFGAYLSVGAVSGTGGFTALPYTPQIDNPAGNILSDTTNWTLISGTFTALGGESHLTIGNFHNNANTTAINAYPSNSLNWAYYYVDEVFVIPSNLQIIGNNICLGDSVTMQAVGDTQFVWVDSLAPNTVLSTTSTLTVSPLVTTTYSVFGTTDTASYTVNVTSTPIFNLGNDTTFCQGGVLLLDATSANATYLWQNNSTNATFSVTQTGTYWVTATSNNCSATDTIHVIVNPLPIMNLGPDITLCQGDSATLNATTANATYLWQDNSTGATFNVTQAGTYWATVTVNNCSTTDSINVVYNSLPVVNLGNDTTLCQGETLPLDATTTNATYVWQNNSMNATFNVNQQGMYWVTVTVNNCSATDSINVIYTPLPLVNLGNDTTLCQGNSLILDATAPNASYLWQDNSTAAILTLTGPGIYWVTVTANNCSASDSIVISYNPLPVVNLGNDTSICQGQTLTLDATATGASYLWQNNSTNASFIVNQQGTYWVTVTISNCTSTDSIIVNYNPLPLIDLGNDTTLCLGSTLTLDATAANTTYLWQDNSANATFTAAQQGIYWVQVTAATGCSNIDSITVNYTPALSLNLGPDLILCAGQTATLNATAPNATYLWQDGGTSAQNLITQSGQYAVDVSNQCETVSDTVNVVYFLPPPNYLGNDTSVCDWAGILLSVNLPGTQTQWQDQSISNTFMVTEPGVYTATTTLQGCLVTDQITIDFLYIPELDLGPDIVVCEIQSLVLADINGAQGSYLWNVGSTQNHVVADTAGLYIVQLTNVCGTTMDTIELIEEGCNCLVYIPNSFTPDFDEHNRLFGVEYDCTFSEYQLRIFDRWGEMIWESRDPEAQWDGTYQNRMAPDGVYIYQLKYSSTGVFDEVVNGHVSLLR